MRKHIRLLCSIRLGYGLSYTTFEQKITDFSSDGTKVTMDVTVTNTGSAAGKDVVQVYYTAPYLHRRDREESCSPLRI